MCCFQEPDRLEDKGGIEVHQIRSVKVNRAGGSSRHIPKAFEIFTDNKSFVLKAKVSQSVGQSISQLVQSVSKTVVPITSRGDLVVSRHSCLYSVTVCCGVMFPGQHLPCDS